MRMRVCHVCQYQKLIELNTYRVDASLFLLMGGFLLPSLLLLLLLLLMVLMLMLTAVLTLMLLVVLVAFEVGPAVGWLVGPPLECFVTAVVVAEAELHT